MTIHRIFKLRTVQKKAENIFKSTLGSVFTENATLPFPAILEAAHHTLDLQHRLLYA